MTTLETLQARLGKRFFAYQAEALRRAEQMQGPQQRLCLYYKTGAGKSITALSAIALWGHTGCVVVAPPSTHPAWVGLGKTIGVEVHAMSHAKFRARDTALSRHTPIIADEMHLFGGQKGQGWKKLDRLAKGLQAPLVLASATPNYNDAERVYCIQHVLDPLSCRGGFIEFIYAHCTTEQNPFGREPIVTGFHRYQNAAEYLADLPGVEYLPDDLVYTITEVDYYTPMPREMDVFGYNRRRHRIIASGMEDRHTRTYQQLVGEDELIRPHVWKEVRRLYKVGEPTLIYANHATVAEAAARTFGKHGIQYRIVTGSSTPKDKDRRISEFIEGRVEVLIGTASLATGTDGMDKICDRLIILDDTDDPSLRRQLIGRIMPRGSSTDASKKKVFRLNA